MVGLFGFYKDLGSIGTVTTRPDAVALLTAAYIMLWYKIHSATRLLFGQNYRQARMRPNSYLAFVRTSR
jgi:hypothetical protein